MIQQGTKKARNVVITGGNNGIGYETVKGLYEDGNNVIFGSRNQQRNKQAFDTISKNQGGTLKYFQLDLSKRASVDEFAKNVQNNFEVVDILLNNAGLILEEKAISQLGIQMTCTINHFGHFYLTYLLFDNVRKSKEGRIINVSSAVHNYSSDDLLDDLKCENKNYKPFEAYSNSKMMNVLFTLGLNNMFKEKNFDNLKTASLHPGIIQSGFGAENCMIKFFQCLCCCLYKNNETGARTNLHLSRVPFSQIRSGEYYNDDTRHTEMNKKARNMENVKKLWEISEKAYGIKFN